MINSFSKEEVAAMACAKKKSAVFRKRPIRCGMLSIEGEKPMDLITYYTKQTEKQRQIMFEKVTSLSRISCKGFLENRARNRVPVPIHEKKRVLLAMVKEGDNEYFPATYASCERDDYILCQAPTKENYRDFWRMVWKDGCKILVSLSEKFSDTDSKLCYPYWPKKEGEKMDIDGKRFVIKCQKKTDFKGYSIYDLGLSSTDPSLDTAVVVGKKSSSKDTATAVDEAATRPVSHLLLRKLDLKSTTRFPPLERVVDGLQVTLMHYENWDSHTWPDLDSLGPFVQSLSKREIQVMRKSLDNYIPPVVIQSYDALGRAPIVWVSTILMKDIEKKECFDVEDLARKCARARPGALHKKIHFFVLIALAFRLSSLGGWTTLSVARANIKEIEEAYNASLKK